MPYSLDFRQKVINFIENGGTITKEAHTFGKGSLDAVGFEQWYDQHLLPSLKIPSVLLHG